MRLLTLVVAVGLVASCSSAADDPRASTTCGPVPPDCRSLARDVVGDPPPIPVGRVGDYEFVNGEKGAGERLLLYIFERETNSDDRLVVVTGRRPSGLEPPATEGEMVETPAGQRVAEREEGSRITALDAWTPNYHFALSFQPATTRGASKYRAGLELIDSLS